MSIYVGTFNPLLHCLRILFGARLQITLRGLSGFGGIGFRIPLSVSSGFQVPPVLVFPAHPLPVLVYRYFAFSIYFDVAFRYLGLIVL